MNAELTRPATAAPRSSWIRRALAVIRLGRPIFLLGGFALYGIGTLAARRSGHAFHLTTYLWGQLAIICIQSMTHYCNDYFDYTADVANRTPTHWSGGSRVLVNGELPRIVALRAALVLAIFAPLAALALFAAGGRAHPQGLSVLLLCAIQALAWSHGGPPLRLHWRGLGEPTTAVAVPLLTLLAGYVVQAGRIDVLPISLSLPLCLLQIVMLLTIEFPDRCGDEKVGKHTWVTLLGPRRAALLTEALLAVAFVSSFAGVALGVPGTVTWAWLCLAPFALAQLIRMLRGAWQRPAAWESLAFGAVALFFLGMVADLVALSRAWPRVH